MLRRLNRHFPLLLSESSFASGVTDENPGC
jgi:hypothetical protein